MKLRSLLFSALLAMALVPNAQAAEELIPTVSSFDFLVDNSGSMLLHPNPLGKARLDDAKTIMARVNAEIPNLPYQGSLHLFSPDAAAQPLAAWDRDAMDQTIRSISTKGDAVGRMTSMAPSVTALTQEYGAMPTPSAAILVSDGMANRGGDPVEAVRELYNAVPGICVHVISVADKPEGQAVLDEIAALKPCTVSVMGSNLLSSDEAVKDFVKRVFYGVPEEEVVVLRGVNFAFDSAVLSADAKGILDEVATVISGRDNVKLVLEGWTDTIGAEAYNKGLSLRRANAVKAYLASKGIDAKAMEAIGSGESQKYDNATSEGRYLNRRVEMLFE